MNLSLRRQANFMSANIGIKMTELEKLMHTTIIFILNIIAIVY